MNVLLLVVICVLLINVPFGFWRLGTRRFSAAWFAAIHLPIPLIAGIRYYSHLGWHLWSVPLIAGAYLTGQYCGGLIRRRNKADPHQ